MLFPGKKLALIRILVYQEETSLQADFFENRQNKIILRGYRIEGLAARLKEIEIEAFGAQMQVQGLFLTSEELSGLLVNMINKNRQTE